MSYTAPLAEMAFCADRIVGQQRLARTARFAEATAETRDAILGEAARLCEETLAPLNRAGDLHPARLENGVVRCPPGFAEGYRRIAEGGWVGITEPRAGSTGLRGQARCRRWPSWRRSARATACTRPPG